MKKKISIKTELKLSSLRYQIFLGFEPLVYSLYCYDSFYFQNY